MAVKVVYIIVAMIVIQMEKTALTPCLIHRFHQIVEVMALVVVIMVEEEVDLVVVVVKVEEAEVEDMEVMEDISGEAEVDMVMVQMEEIIMGAVEDILLKGEIMVVEVDHMGKVDLLIVMGFLEVVVVVTEIEVIRIMDMAVEVSV